MLDSGEGAPLLLQGVPKGANVAICHEQGQNQLPDLIGQLIHQCALSRANTTGPCAPIQPRSGQLFLRLSGMSG